MSWLARLKELPGVSYIVHKGDVIHMNDQPSERDQLIAAAQEAGVQNPWFKSNEDLKAAIEAAGQAPAAVEPEAETEASDLGADAADPYAHLGSNAPTGDEPEAEE